jgi:hypothetical protein
MPEYSSAEFDITKLFDYSGKIKTAKEITIEEFVEEYDYETALTKEQVFNKFGLKDADIMTADLIRYGLEGKLDLYYRKYALGIVTDMLRTDAGKEKIKDMFCVYSKYLDVKQRVDAEKEKNKPPPEEGHGRNKVPLQKEAEENILENKKAEGNILGKEKIKKKPDPAGG